MSRPRLWPPRGRKSRGVSREDFGRGLPLVGTARDVCAVMVYTVPARKARALELAAELGAGVALDEGRGIVANATAALEQAAQVVASDALMGIESEPRRRWVCICEDDVSLAAGLNAETLPRVLETLPEDACAFSLHSESPEPLRRWRRRYRGEVLRVQFAGFRVELLKDLVSFVRGEAARFAAKPARAALWDSSVARFLDARELAAYIRLPSLVQHDCPRGSQSTMGHRTRSAPTFTGVL